MVYSSVANYYLGPCLKTWTATICMAIRTPIVCKPADLITPEPQALDLNRPFKTKWSALVQVDLFTGLSLVYMVPSQL